MVKVVKPVKKADAKIGYPSTPVLKHTGNKRLDCFFEPEEVVKKYHSYRTDYHKIRVSGTLVENFLNRIERTTKKGPKFSKEAQHYKMCEFVMKRAKPLEPKMSGSEWEESMKSLLFKIFEERWDREFDKGGEEKDFVMPSVTTEQAEG